MGYILLQAVTCVALMVVNTFGVPIVNMLSWLLLFTVIVIVFYTENGKNILQRVVEVIGLILILSICEIVVILYLIHNLRFNKKGVAKCNNFFICKNCLLFKKSVGYVAAVEKKKRVFNNTKKEVTIL